MAKFCENCGAEVKEGAQVCLQCGTIISGGKKKAENANPNAKSKMAAGLLGIFLGAFGVHNFYLGYTGKAIAQLLLFLVGGTLTCGILYPVPAIWGLIEGILILCGNIDKDADGNPLVD